MTKKFLAVMLVLVLAAGFAAVAQEDDRALTGSWENTLTLDPTQEADYNADNPFRFDSLIEATYMTGGVTFTGEAEFDYDTREGTYLPEENGLTDMEFGAETTVGLLDLSSTVNFNTESPGLDFWTNQASLTLGGVSISDTFVLQDVYDMNESPGDYGAGMDLMISGETPGGVSVAVNNYFGMEPLIDSDGDGYAQTGLVSGKTFGTSSIPYNSGYHIVTAHSWQNGDPVGEYGASSLQYVATKLTLDNLSLGCCDFSNTTLFSEAYGFEYTMFEFTIEASNMPLSLEGDLKFTPQTKSITLNPSLTTDWACFTVYTDLTTAPAGDGVLGNNGYTDDVLDGLEIEGFAITGVELGHVEFSSYTALGDNDLYDLEGWMFYTGYGTLDYDEVFRIEKLEEYPLDFTLDTYFDMSDSDALFDLTLFDGSMSYDIDEEFTIGTGVTVEPNNGLQAFEFTFDYSF